MSYRPNGLACKLPDMQGNQVEQRNRLFRPDPGVLFDLLSFRVGHERSTYQRQANSHASVGRSIRLFFLVEPFAKGDRVVPRHLRDGMFVFRRKGAGIGPDPIGARRQIHNGSTDSVRFCGRFVSRFVDKLLEQSMRDFMHTEIVWLSDRDVPPRESPVVATVVGIEFCNSALVPFQLPGG